ncbi:MAG: HAMP domain-containing protein [Pseudomonadota bacterium]|nr:MAG: HAMP domain-containing protein [Pseudomonadota bacterium]
MVPKPLRKLFSGATPWIILVVLLLASLYLMSQATHNAAMFEELYSVLLGANVLALFFLVVLIVQNLHRLRAQYRDQAPGARLTARLVVMFIVMSVTPVTVVYYFSLDFLRRGIDSWFDVRVEQALGDALELSRTSLDMRMRELLSDTHGMSIELIATPNELAVLALHDLRSNTEATELTLFTMAGRIVASSTAEAGRLIPARLDDATQMRVRQGIEDVGLVPLGDAGLHIRVAVNVPSPDPVTEARILQALYPVTERMNTLADSVQGAFGQYRELAYLRKPLKYSFVLTLSMVLLLSILTAVYAAFFSSRRLVAPIRDLAEGTRAVAAGDYEKRLPMPGKDELGFLVRSFNDMIREIAQAQAEARRSQQEVEHQRSYLEGVLGNLSSGVMTFDTEHCLHTSNTVASQMLGIALEDYRGQHLVNVVDENTHTQYLVDNIGPHIEGDDHDWSEEIELFGGGGRKVMMWRGTSLPSTEGQPGGHVIVFDDITDMMQAQRDAAWGEVARRLAHEIKNPLTPIQLSAERLRHKYLGKMEPQDAIVLDRSTRTIVAQVETLKEMVKAFSDYARMPKLQLHAIDLNKLIYEVSDLYQDEQAGIRIRADLDQAMPNIEADDGRLRQLLHNLLKNALEATGFEPGAHVAITSRCMQEYKCHFVEVRVQDDGPGIPEDIMGQLFEPYVTTKPKGSGLGLAIVKKIVEEHGGMLWAENIGSGGACMVIRLPVLGASKEDSALPSVESAQATQGKDDAAA